MLSESGTATFTNSAKVADRHTGLSSLHIAIASENHYIAAIGDPEINCEATFCVSFKGNLLKRFDPVKV